MTEPKTRELTIKDYIYSPHTVKRLEAALPTFMKPDRFLRVFYTALNRNENLHKCTKESILSCMIQSAQLGLEPILGKAALIPYGTECQFQPMYQGLIDLARRTGDIAITAHVVYENDDFDISYGTDEKLVHKPTIRGPRGDMLGAYTVWTYPSGPPTFLFMPEEEILDIRNKYSKSYKASDSMWQKRPGEAYKKTVIKNHSKLQPCSIEMDIAVHLDHLVDTGQSQSDYFLEGAQGKEKLPIAAPTKTEAIKAQVQKKKEADAENGNGKTEPTGPAPESNPTQGNGSEVPPIYAKPIFGAELYQKLMGARGNFEGMLRNHTNIEEIKQMPPELQAGIKNRFHALRPGETYPLDEDETEPSIPEPKYGFLNDMAEAEKALQDRPGVFRDTLFAFRDLGYQTADAVLEEDYEGIRRLMKMTVDQHIGQI